MRNYLLVLLLLLPAAPLMAQHGHGDSLNQRLFGAKVRELALRLEMSKEQRAKFVPIYRRYNEEMIAAWGEHKKTKAPSTSQEAAQLAKVRMERQQRAQGIRMKYIDELATVLNARQVSRFFDVESQIQTKLRNRRNHPQGVAAGARPRKTIRR